MAAKVKKECGKCGGTGEIRMYKHIAGGTCFSCHGRGYFLVDPVAQEKYQKRKEKAKQEKEAKHQAIRAYNQAKYQAFIEEMKENPDFIRRMQGRNPKEEGYQLGFNIMQVYEKQNLWRYES